MNGRKLALLIAILMVGGALALLVLMNDFGTSLLFFGVFLAMLYLATSRVVYVVAGLAVFVLGAYFSYRLVPHVADRVDIWLHPWHDVYGSGYQSVQAIYAIADGGAFGTGLTVNGAGSYAVGDPNTINGNNSFVFGGGNNVNTATNAGCISGSSPS